MMSMFAIVIDATQFVEKRGIKKQPSLGALKDELCEQSGALLKSFSPLLHDIANLQTRLLATMQEYLEGNKGSWYEQASRTKLSDCSEKLRLLQEKITTVHDECTKLLKEMGA